MNTKRVVQEDLVSEINNWMTAVAECATTTEKTTISKKVKEFCEKIVVDLTTILCGCASEVITQERIGAAEISEAIININRLINLMRNGRRPNRLLKADCEAIQKQAELIKFGLKQLCKQRRKPEGKESISNTEIDIIHIDSHSSDRLISQVAKISATYSHTPQNSERLKTYLYDNDLSCRAARIGGKIVSCMIFKLPGTRIPSDRDSQTHGCIQIMEIIENPDVSMEIVGDQFLQPLKMKLSDSCRKIFCVIPESKWRTQVCLQNNGFELKEIWPQFFVNSGEDAYQMVYAEPPESIQLEQGIVALMESGDWKNLQPPQRFY